MCSKLWSKNKSNHVLIAFYEGYVFMNMSLKSEKDVLESLRNHVFGSVYFSSLFNNVYCPSLMNYYFWMSTFKQIFNKEI